MSRLRPQVIDDESMDQILPVAFYGTVLIIMFVLVQAVVRISQAFVEITRILEDMAVSLRRRGSF